MLQKVKSAHICVKMIFDKFCKKLIIEVTVNNFHVKTQFSLKNRVHDIAATPEQDITSLSFWLPFFSLPYLEATGISYGLSAQNYNSTYILY